VPFFDDDKGSNYNRSAFIVTSICNQPPTLGQSSPTSVEHHTTLTQTSLTDVMGFPLMLRAIFLGYVSFGMNHGNPGRGFWI
jgi:hypothetical protein